MAKNTPKVLDYRVSQWTPKSTKRATPILPASWSYKPGRTGLVKAKANG